MTLDRLNVFLWIPAPLFLLSLACVHRFSSKLFHQLEQMTNTGSEHYILVSVFLQSRRREREAWNLPTVPCEAVSFQHFSLDMGKFGAETEVHVMEPRLKHTHTFLTFSIDD